MRLSSLITGPVHGCGGRVTLREAARSMADDDHGSMVVLDGTRLTGILTERDVIAAVAGGVDVDRATVDEWMTRDPDTAAPDLEVKEAANWMLAVGYRHLPIVEDGELLGVTSIKDVLWALVDDDD